ncbi:MAG: LysM peptidoglycan-binding domain-containing protein [Leptospiraceae bacterium]|nr:LysM peptidoglycan-binding domain-containing protein [Leptospiraceae bacterium]MCB1321516.1 LysM peptidoglycan-binding domain-containing protein [Leptospiraceae bacterium]
MATKKKTRAASSRKKTAKKKTTASKKKAVSKKTAKKTGKKTSKKASTKKSSKKSSARSSSARAAGDFETHEFDMGVDRGSESAPAYTPAPTSYADAGGTEERSSSLKRFAIIALLGVLIIGVVLYSSDDEEDTSDTTQNIEETMEPADATQEMVDAGADTADAGADATGQEDVADATDSAASEVDATDSAAAGTSTQYTVKSGDTLSSVCRSQRPQMPYNTCVAKVKELSGKTGNVLEIGEVLTLPAP